LTQVSPPPIYEHMIEQDGKATLPWILFFNNIFNGSSGTDFTPTFQNLTTVGTPTISGRYYKLGSGLVFFRITIIPATSTSAVAGTTYCDNFPLLFSNDSANLAVSGGAGGNAGMNVASNNRIYPSGWSAVTVPLTIVGMGEIQS